jgi:hypothetical protein
MPATTIFFKPEIEKVKKFIKEHQTTTACAATAVVAVVVTRKVDTKIAKKFAYEMGKKAGVLEAHLERHWEFLEAKDLDLEFEEFAWPTVK